MFDTNGNFSSLNVLSKYSYTVILYEVSCIKDVVLDISHTH